MNSLILPQGFCSMREWISYSIFELQLEAQGNQQMADRIVIDQRLHPHRILAAQMARANFLGFKQRCLDQIRVWKRNWRRRKEGRPTLTIRLERFRNIRV